MFYITYYAQFILIMEKTKKFIETELQKYDDLYWEYHSKVQEKEKVITQLQNEVNYLKADVAKYDAERKHYQELYKEFNLP